MKYKVITIKGIETNYKKRVYLITKQEREEMHLTDTLVLRKSITGDDILRSVETDKHYMIVD